MASLHQPQRRGRHELLLRTLIQKGLQVPHGAVAGQLLQGGVQRHRLAHGRLCRKISTSIGAGDMTRKHILTWPIGLASVRLTQRDTWPPKRRSRRQNLDAGMAGAPYHELQLFAQAIQNARSQQRGVSRMNLCPVCACGLRFCILLAPRLRALTVLSCGWRCGCGAICSPCFNGQGGHPVCCIALRCQCI